MLAEMKFHLWQIPSNVTLLYYIQFQHCIDNLISMVDYNCGFTVYCYIIWCLRGFLSDKQVVHNSCNIGTRGLPNLYTLSPRGLGVYIRQTAHAHVTTIKYIIYHFKN